MPKANAVWNNQGREGVALGYIGKGTLRASLVFDETKGSFAFAIASSIELSIYFRILISSLLPFNLLISIVVLVTSVKEE